MIRRRAALWPTLALAAATLSSCGNVIPQVAPAAKTAPPAATAPAPEPMVILPSFSAQEAAALRAPASDEPAQRGFAQFVRYARNVAIAAKGGGAPLSAMLNDPVALDGRRRTCAPGEQPVAMIDLDPAGGLFAPPTNPAQLPGLALGLAVLREAGVAIAWRSDLPVEQTGPMRTALERAGLDPRGQDILSLRQDAADRKQARLENLAATACIIAIAADERSDFDERFRYLRTPEAAAGLEPLFGDGWFMVEPVFLKEGQQTQ